MRKLGALELKCLGNDYMLGARNHEYRARLQEVCQAGNRLFG